MLLVSRASTAPRATLASHSVASLVPTAAAEAVRRSRAGLEERSDGSSCEFEEGANVKKVQSVPVGLAFPTGKERCVPEIAVSAFSFGFGHVWPGPMVRPPRPPSISEKLASAAF